MRRLVILGALLVAGCGADGMPEPPGGGRPAGGVVFSGEAQVGLRTGG